MMDPKSDLKPAFFFNFSIDDALTTWEHVPTLDVPPCSVPPGVPCSGSVRMIDSSKPKQPLAKAAVFAGLKVSAKQLVKMMPMVGAKLPEKGTGVNGNIVKADRANAIVNHLFPAENEDEKQRMVHALCGKAWAMSMEECPSSVIEAAASLDPENIQGFRRTIIDAKKLQQSLEKRAKRNKEVETTGPDTIVHEGTSTIWSKYTPKELQALMPGKHELPYVYLKITGNRYQGVYQCATLSCDRNRGVRKCVNDMLPYYYIAASSPLSHCCLVALITRPPGRPHRQIPAFTIDLLTVGVLCVSFENRMNECFHKSFLGNLGALEGVQETKACTFGGVRDSIPEDEALRTVLDFMFALHAKARPEHAHQQRPRLPTYRI